MTDDLPPVPEFPIIVTNPRFVEGCFNRISTKIHYWMSQECFDNGIFTKDTYVFDNRARKFKITKLHFVRRTYDFTGLWNRRDYIKVSYDYEFLKQLTFEEVRSVVLEHICKKRWYGQTGGNQAQFREITNKCADMQALSNHVQFYGKWLR